MLSDPLSTDRLNSLPQVPARWDGRKLAKRINEMFDRHMASTGNAMDAALATIAEEFDGSNRLPCGCAKDASYICLAHWRPDEANAHCARELAELGADIAEMKKLMAAG